ncbi:MAG: HD family phosphohydrolase, partial [Gemmatimonadota bacterium]
FSLPQLQLYQALIVRFAEPTLALDRPLTEAAREQARAAVNPVLGEVLADERVIRAHERLRAQDVTRLRAYQQALAERGLGGGGIALGRTAGSILLNLLVLGVFGLLLSYYRPEIYRSPPKLAVAWGLLVVVMAVAGAASRAEAPPELIPVAVLGVSLAVLYGAPLTLAAVFTVSVLVAARPPFLGISALLMLWLAGAAAAMGVRVVRRRMQILGVGATITSAYLLAAICLGLLHGTAVSGVLFSTALGALNALISASVAFVCLPLLEKFTGITTDLTLVELADMNHPLLRRLSLEAPGTYAHSINVANLAEAAAHAVGGNTLLARVGAYYHDVGKLKRPHYFVENQHGPNPHDQLKPAMSAAVVREHVVEGIELAREAGLPYAVRAFIPEHHGTQRIGFFFDKAREDEPDARLDEASFRYPGPKPQSKETAISMLADGVESATRALQDRTPERIRELIDRIVARRVEEGQLEDAPLTLHEVQLIKEQFAVILAGMYHQRIDYPLTAEMAPPSPPPREAAERT